MVFQFRNNSAEKSEFLLTSLTLNFDHKRPKFGTLRCRKNSVEMSHWDIKLFWNKSSDGSKIKYTSVPEKFEFAQFICSKQVKYWIYSDGSRIWTSNIGSYAMTSISNGDLLSWLCFELAIGSRKTIKIFCRCKLWSLVWGRCMK